MTYQEAIEIEGICHECKEWTNLAETCCGMAIECEGSSYHPDLVEKQIEALPKGKENICLNL